jgi:hypothetical protein
MSVGISCGPPEAARAAVYGNRNRLRSGVGNETGASSMRKRGEVVERSFAHVLDRGGMRRTWLRAAKMSTNDISSMSPVTISAF